MKSIFAVVALLALATARPAHHARQAPATTPLNDLIKAKGKLYFGTATDFLDTTGERTDTTYQEILNTTSEFGAQTPGNAMKYDTTEPTQGQFNYAPGQQVLDYAAANGQLVRCHNLIWHQQLPSWLTSRTWTSADNATLQGIMKNHITSLITHYADACYAWDVVNEPLVDGTGALQSSPWLDAIGPEYFPLAFKFASDAAAQVKAATGKDIKLYVNEYNDEYAGTKTTALLNLVQSVQAREIRIDGVGFESHFIVGQTPDRATQAAAKKQFADLGLDVAVTELDVRFSSLPPTSAGLAQQATDYVNSVGSCLDVEKCVGVTVWDFEDKYSWIPSTFSGQGEADLYSDDYSAKPAVAAIQELLAG